MTYIKALSVFILLFINSCSHFQDSLKTEEYNIRNSIVFVQPSFSGRYITSNIEKYHPKKTNGFLVMKKENAKKKYYLVTVNHLLLFFRENEVGSNFICNDPEKRAHHIDIFSDGKGKKHLLTINKDDMEKSLQASKRESTREKADVAVVDITDMVTDDILGKCINYNAIAKDNIYNEINSKLKKGHAEIQYYSFMKNGHWHEDAQLKKAKILSSLGEVFILPDGRNFLGFKLKENVIERGDCGAPIVYNYKDKLFIIGLINTQTTHTDLTQDSRVIRQNIEQFK